MALVKVVQEFSDLGEELLHAGAKGPDPLASPHRFEVLGEILHGPPLLQVDEDHRGLDVHGGVVVQAPRPGQRVGRRCRPEPLEHRGRPPEPGEHHGQQEHAKKHVDGGKLLLEAELQGKGQCLDQGNAKKDFDVQERNQHRADEHVVAHQVHGHLARAAREPG